MIEYLKKSIEIDKRRLQRYKKAAMSSATGRINRKWDHRRKKAYYYYKGPDDEKEHPLQEQPNAKIWRLQVKRFAQAMSEVIRNNIEVKQKLLDELLPDTEDAVMARIHKAYRPNAKFKPEGKADKKIVQSENPYKRDQLNIQTSFGLYVRTKSEMIIAELLYSLGIEFYYERQLTLHVLRNGEWVQKHYYPDFTIILSDGSTIYWEHKGMMSNVDYVQRNVQKCVDYNMNGIFQSHNYIVTEEGPDNQLDYEGIKRIVLELICG